MRDHKENEVGTKDHKEKFKAVMQKILNYINGELIEPKSGNYLDNYNPAEGKVYSQVPDSDGFDVHHATVAARKAFGAWSSMPVSQRSSILQKIAALIDR